jgi:hypothetical protein
LKKFALRHLITPDEAFGQAFRQKSCDQNISKKFAVIPPFIRLAPPDPKRNSGKSPS